MARKINQIRKIRQLIRLFESYGIQLTGRKKFNHFNEQLQMDQIFVNGLIFEVECLLQKEIDCNWNELNSPSDVIKQVLVEN